MSNLDELAAALDKREITDDEGQIKEEDTSVEESATQEKNTEEESATAEKPAESIAKETESESLEDEIPLAEDESGKRYVPEKRFKEVYGEKKQLERDLQAKDELIQTLMSQGLSQTEAKKQSEVKPTESETYIPSKADLLELRMTLPQFDPKFDEEGKPTNSDYSQELDKLGYQLLKANPGITPLEAGRKALKIARDISKQEISLANKAREAKSSASDQGITSRVVSRQPEKFDFDNATDQEIEEHLRSTGQW